MPTPNGPLHLGHMAGPYLKTDVLRRHIRMHGGEAYIVSGSDVYESHIELKASQLGITEAAVCDQFHRRISAELAALKIECDYVDPLQPENHEEYVAFNLRTIDQLAAKGGVESVAERVVRDKDRGHYLAGCWASGNCPICGARSGSYLCEGCGAHYKPEDLRAAGKGAADDVQTVESLFLRIRKRGELLEHIERMGIEPGFSKIVGPYFESQGDRVRLTNPGKWGIRHGGPDQVVFTYTALFSFSVYCAELLKRTRGLRVNPFDPSSGFTTVAAFGIDNAVPYLVGVLGCAIELGDIKPFDYYLTNYFYYLEGAKFSTSRVHLAYARDLVTDAGVSSDALRYFLTKANPENEPKSFVVREFLDVNNDELAGTMERTLAAALELARQASPAEPAAGIVDQLARELEVQASHLRLPATNMARGLASIDTWLRSWRELEHQPANAYWWLKGFVMLAYPFLPDVGETIWSALGHVVAPNASEFLQRPAMPRAAAPERFFTPVSSAAVEQCVFRDGARGTVKQ